MPQETKSSDRIATAIVLLAGATAYGLGELAHATDGRFGDVPRAIGGLLLVVGGWSMLQSLIGSAD